MHGLLPIFAIPHGSGRVRAAADFYFYYIQAASHLPLPPPSLRQHHCVSTSIITDIASGTGGIGTGAKAGGGRCRWQQLVLVLILVALRQVRQVR